MERELTDARGLVYRYRGLDGLDGKESTFLLCTFWLATALARAGRIYRGRLVFEHAAELANDVALPVEEFDPTLGEHIGDFPQTFSRIALVGAAWAIA